MKLAFPFKKIISPRKKTRWFFCFYNLKCDENQIIGESIKFLDAFDNQKNKIPRKVKELIKKEFNSKKFFFFRKYRPDDYVLIKVLKNDKWVSIYFWPVKNLDI